MKLKLSLILACICWGMFLGTAAGVLLDVVTMTIEKSVFVTVIFLTAAFASLANYRKEDGKDERRK